MDIRKFRNAGLAVALALMTPCAFGAFDPVNDDTDIFLADPTFVAQRPNVLIIMDNTANWNQPFNAEKTALVNVVNGLSNELNVGLMMFTETGGGNGTPDGAYVRYAIRQMTSTNKAGFTGLVNSLDSNGDKSNNGKMGLAMYEAYLYYAGKTAYAGANKTKRDYTGNTAGGPSGSVPGSFTGSAFTSAGSTTYVSPIIDACQKNFIIYISNGKAQDNNNDLTTSQNALTAINNNVTPTQISLSNISPESSSQQGNWADEWARWMSVNDCNVPVSGVQNVITYTIDIGPANVTDPSNQGAGWTTLLKSTAASSGGKYFSITASDPDAASAIEKALKTVFNEVQAVNNVFAATTLPVSVNVRGTNLNQIYIGVFRPDAQKLPRWFGNLKLYKLGVQTGLAGTPDKVFLADANGGVASNLANGFISGSALSYWTTTSNFWAFRGIAPNSYSSTDVGQQSDAPDGDLVEKGGAAERIRMLFPASQGGRKVYTCTSASGGICPVAALLSSTPFSAGGTGNPADNTDISAADVNAYSTYSVASLASSDNGNGTSTVTAVLSSIPNPSFSTGSNIVRIAGALPALFNGDWAISNYAEDVTAGTATFTYQISSVLPGNVAAVQMASGVSHQLRTGDLVTVSGGSPAIYNVTDAPITFINSGRFTYTLTGNASGPATTLPTIQGKKVVSSITGSGNSATASISAHGYSGASVTGFSITGSSVTAFNNVLGNTANSSNPNSLDYTTGAVISGSATTAKVSATSHELQTGDLVTVTGSTTGYNATNAAVTVIDANTFTYVPVGPIVAANTQILTVTAKRNINLSATDTPGRSLKVGASKGTAIGNSGSLLHGIQTPANWRVTITGVTTPAGDAGNFNVTNLAITAPTTTTFTYSISNSVGANTTAGGTINAALARNSFTVALAGAVPVVSDNGAGIYAVTTISPQSVSVRSNATGNITAGRPTDSSAPERAKIMNWVRGEDNKENENQDCTVSPYIPCSGTNTTPRLTDIRTSVHGDVLHSRPAVVNYNRFTDDNDVYAFYGGNDGMVHAVKGGAASSETGVSPGDERWTFVPREFFPNLKRLRDNNPSVSSTIPKPYFADGPLAVYQKDANGDGKLDPAGNSGDKVYLYIGFHRGGRFLYALDTTDPATPKLLWRRTNTDSGYAELGQTWSTPIVTKLAANIGNTNNPENVVLIFGAGYDPNVDDVNPCLLQSVSADSVTLKPIGTGTVDYSTPIGSCTINNATGSATTRSRTQGRGILIVDAFSGDVVWQVGRAPGAVPNVTRSDMSCSIPADVTPIDIDRNGTTDFIYAADTCGNIWRIDVASSAIGDWQVNKLASLSTTVASDINNHRHFLYPPDAVSSSDTTGDFIAVLAGTGDRQHPFDTSIQDRFYMIKDRTAPDPTTGTMSQPTTVLDADLFDATNANGSNDFGWKMDLALGEKNVGGVVTLSSTTFFNTNQPSSAAGGGACSSNLGIARQYSINFEDAGATGDLNSSGGAYTTEDRAQVVKGGGFLPSPVPATVEIDGKKYQVVISGVQVQQPPGTTLDARTRTYWYREFE